MSAKIVRGKDGKLRRGVDTKAPQSTGYREGNPIKILFGVQKCKFITPYPAVLYKALVAPYPNYWHTPSFKARKWDGMHHFITHAGYFPAGLLPVVFHILTTAINPLIPANKKGYNVRITPTKNIKIVPQKGCEKFFHEGYPRFFSFPPEPMTGFNKDTGTFSFPVDFLKCWGVARGNHPLAKRILSFAKELKK